MTWRECLTGVVSNLASTKLVLGLVAIFTTANSFQSTSMGLQEWVYFLSSIVLIATGHSLFRMIEKKNGNGNGNGSKLTQ